MKLIMTVLLSPLVMGAPQYGGSSGGHSAPSQAQTSVHCRTENQVVWDTKYIETETQNCITVQVPQCKTAYKNQCVPTTRQECQTVYKQQCTTQYEQQCSTKYKQELEYYTETECSTDYKEDCEYQWEGTGNNKVWAPIPGSCKNNPYDKCGDVQKQKQKQVPYQDCQSVPRQNCQKVPQQECRQVPDQKCSKVPYQDCQNVPSQQCNPVHKKVPQRISKTVPKKVCDGGSGGGFNSGSGNLGDYDLDFGFNSGTGNIPRNRNENADAEVFSDKLVNLKSGDAVNFG